MSKAKMFAFALSLSLVAMNLGPTLSYAADSPGSTTVLTENFDTVSDGGIPTGWNRDNTPNFGVALIGGTANKVAYGDFSHFPYENSSVSSLVSPRVDLSGATSAALGFDTRCDTNAGDFMSVTLLANGGSTQQLSQWNTQSIDATTQPGSYAQKHMTFDVPQSVLTSNVQLKFTWTTGPTRDGDHNGCAIDNVLLTKVSQSSATTTATSTPSNTSGQTSSTTPVVTIITPTATNYAIGAVPIDVTLGTGGVCDFTLDNVADHSPLASNSSNTEFTASTSDLTTGNHSIHVYCVDFANHRNDANQVSFSIGTVATSTSSGQATTTTATTTQTTATSTATTTPQSTNSAAGQATTTSTTTTTTAASSNTSTNTSSQSASRGGGGGGGGGVIYYTIPNTVKLTNTKADINLDNRVDLMDFNLLMSEWGKQVTSLTKSDLNGDGAIDILDFNILMANWTK